MEVSNDAYNLSPRNSQTNARLKFNETTYSGLILTGIDTEREKAIGLGEDWPFPPLKANECLITEKFAKANNITKGVTVDIRYDNDKSGFF